MRINKVNTQNKIFRELFGEKTNSRLQINIVRIVYVSLLAPCGDKSLKSSRCNYYSERHARISKRMYINMFRTNKSHKQIVVDITHINIVYRNEFFVSGIVRKTVFVFFPSSFVFTSMFA